MKTTLTLSQSLGCTPFEVFEQDVDEVIMLINFYLQIGNAKNGGKPKTFIPTKEKRIKVNDQTATGGWF